MGVVIELVPSTYIRINNSGMYYALCNEIFKMFYGKRGKRNIAMLVALLYFDTMKKC